MKHLMYFLVAFLGVFMLVSNGLNAQCTVPGFPFVDNSPTGWTAEWQEQGYDVTTDANGDIYVVGMTYKSNPPNPINDSDLTVYKLDNCGQMLWKTTVPSNSVSGINIWADDVHSGKILVVNGKVYFGISNEIEITSRIYRLDASNGSPFPYPNSGKNYVEFKGKMTDFDLEFSLGQPEILYVASVYPGNQEGLILKI
jgi:outer membrane protein assembly factor BamB